MSLLYLSIGNTGRKMLTDKYPHRNIFVIDLADMLERCRASFEMRRKRTLDRHAFLSREQQPGETFHQYWNIFNCLASKCDFGEQTQCLVYDIFLVNMSNKQVQKRLCTEPKDPAAELHFAIVFEEVLRRQKSIGQPSTSTKTKGEPVFVVSSQGDKREC